MTFDQIEKKVKSLRDPELDEGPLRSIARWLDELRAALGAMRDRLDGEIARLEAASSGGDDFGRLAAAHPAGSWLLRRRAGKLSPSYLGCSTPEQVFAIANALGVAVETRPLGDASR
jgi:hypothetical protein